MDTAFRAVIEACARDAAPGQSGTWITPAIVDAYTELHARGNAHSVEAWRDGRLVGGLYGVSIGRMFFGESMFARRARRVEGRARASGGDAARARLSRSSIASRRPRISRRFGARPIPREAFAERISPRW